ncbi:hypothetical protein [Porphyromonas sp. oral taxon 278]|uniref:hypothetical protein n=1 Tax=Porphyromonas sp. oral taxon 278 TaxID=712437 RepID=UPI0025D2D4FF|nr:hypothetical protein [Porphyromonas sp. oral taxon 278]
MSTPVSTSISRYLRTSGPVFGVIILFVFLALAYFAPAVFEGRELFQQDVAGASGNASDVYRHMESSGEFSYWTNSLFGGMPMYQIAPSYPSVGIIRGIQDVLTLQWPFCLLPGYSWLLFAMLGGFYLFMRALRVDRIPSVLGAIMWTFSSYFIILITAGHIWKLMTLAFIPPTIAGIIHSYRGRYLLGGAMTALFAALQILSNHVQMSYYFAFLIVFIILGYFVEAVREKKFRPFIFASLVTLFSGLIALGINSSNLYHTYEYGLETTRGGSELTPLPSADGQKQVEANAKGLDKEYITAWSYGKAETFTLLVPNLYGGASEYLGNDPEAIESVPAEFKEIIGGMNHYWGDQPFTAGPVYVGAFVLFLFVLGVIKVQGPLKWALLGGTIFSIALAWGHNMMWLSDLFIDHVPLYNKFRTVSSILVVAEFTIPALAVLALVQFVREPKAFLEDKVALYVSLGLTLLPCLVLWLIPQSVLALMSGQEQEMFRQAMGRSQLPVTAIMASLKEVRAGIVSADALRSAVIIVLSLVPCFLYAQGKLKKVPLFALLGLITLADLWLVDKRYLHDDLFIPKESVEAQARPVTDVDKAIAQDTDPHYRVMNLAVNSFNDATTSANHRSVGGYHAAKLRRYQDLIERQLAQQNPEVYNMLDTRYFIFADKDRGLMYQRNPDAFGPAWFVDDIHWVASADEEMAGLDSTALRQTALVDKRFSSELQGYKAATNSLASTDSLSAPSGQASVKLLTYTPSMAKYQVTTDEPRLLVFSEIYYPHGWHLTLDGKKELPIVRANYVLRAAYIPQGTHELTMTFDPASIHRTELIAEISTGLLVLLLVASALLPLIRRGRKQAELDSVHN